MGLEKNVLYHIDRITDYNFEYETVNRNKFNKHSGKMEKFNYANMPVSFDIESSSFRDEGDDQVAIMYAFALNIDGYCFLGRTWEDFTEALNFIVQRAGLNYHNRMIIYVHNLSFDFFFAKKHFNFVEVNANGSEHKIMSAVTDKGIEFRCSYMLSSSSLKNVAKNLVDYKIEKMVGDLDYNLIRTPLTPLTEKELGYIINDVVIMEYFIRESMHEKGDNILNLPLTNTGYVREYIRKITIGGKEKKHREYRKLIMNLKMETTEYMALREAFAGGYTHANPTHVGKVMYNVKAKDFASSYPARMITYQYPMSKGELYYCKTKKDFFEQINTYCCLFYVKFKALNRIGADSYISISKTRKSKGVVNNNGRIESAEYVEMWMTELDFRCVMMSYEVSDFDIGPMYRYKKGYLPKELIEGIIKLYKDKTKLKGIKEYIAEYNRSKGMLNSVYGMCVTDIIREMFEWNPTTSTNDKQIADDYTIDELIQKENNSKKRFLFYPWGVWITAYARFDLFKEVIALGDRFVYCDTDSIYYQEDEKAIEIFEESNKRIIGLLEKTCEHHGIDMEEVQPKDPNGKVRTIGIWSHDGDYTRFKTLGAKRYMVELLDDEGKLKINITVSGVNKSSAVPYILENFDDPFEAFSNKLHIPAGECGKSTHTYVNDVKVGTVYDYNGVQYEYEELSGIHLEETYYTMKISNEYTEYLEWITNGRPRR